MFKDTTLPWSGPAWAALRTDPPPKGDTNPPMDIDPKPDPDPLPDMDDDPPNN